MSLWTRGVVACACLLLAGCGGGSTGPVEIDSPPLSAADQKACTQLLDSLPARFEGRSARKVTPADAPGAAWGDPPITLTCGVGVPASFDRLSQCVLVNGVGWYVPEDEANGGDATFTAVGYRPRVALHVPGEDQPEGGAAALADLAAPVRQHLQLVKPCH